MLGIMRHNWARDEQSVLGLLTREQDRKLRAAAWRHVRRINPVVARRIWIARRNRDLLEKAA